MAKSPGRHAMLRGFMALVLDMVRVDAERRPSAEMVLWYRELAAEAGVEARPVPTARDLLAGGLEIARALHQPLEAFGLTPGGGPVTLRRR